MARANTIQEIEDIHTRTFGRGARVIGITGPKAASGVTTISKSLATRCALGGQNSLLLDMSRAPSDKRATDQHGISDPEQTGQNIWKATGGYDVLPINPEGQDKYRFRDARSLSEMIRNELGQYDQVIVDLAPLPDLGEAAVPAGIGASACDAVILVCRTYAVTQSEVEDAVKSLADNEAKIAGLVMNDQNAPTVGQELIREFERISWMLPKGVQEFVERKIASTKVLNTKI